MMKLHPLSTLALVVFLSGSVLAQGTPDTLPAGPAAATTKPWTFSFTTDGYIVPHDRSYVNPNFSADRGRLHLEARYNYEDAETGSMWFGSNFSIGRELVLEATPMIGGVLGNTSGIAPGYKASLSYKRFELSSQGEYVFNTEDTSGSFFYNWSELTYSPAEWLRTGLVTQRTRAYHTSLDIQRGLLVGFSYKRVDFTTYVFNAGWIDPTWVLELGISF